MRAPMTTWSWRTNERERRRKPISLPLNFRGNCVFDVRNGQGASERIEILSKHLTQSQRGKILPEAQRGEGLNPLLTLSNTLVGNWVVTKFTQPHPLVTIFLADKSLHWKLLLLLPNSMVICLALSFSVSLGTCLCLQNWIQYLPLTTAMEPYANLESHFCRTMHNLTFDSGQIIPTIG